MLRPGPAGDRQRGWTQAAPDFSVPVQPVQAVQPNLKEERGESFSAPAETVERRRRPLSLPTEVLLAKLGQVGLAGHGSVVHGLVLVRERYAVSQIAAWLTRESVIPPFSRAPTRHKVVGSCRTLGQRNNL